MEKVEELKINLNLRKELEEKSRVVGKKEAKIENLEHKKKIRIKN